MAEKLPNDFILAGISVEKYFCRSMSEAVRRHFKPGMSIDEFADLNAQGTVPLW